MLEQLKKAKIGEIIPIYKEIDYVDSLVFFAKLSDYGRKKKSIYFEFKDKVIASANPCLKITGFRERFEIVALNNTGLRFIAFIKNDFKFCDKVQFKKDKIIGELKIKNRKITEDQRLKIKGHMEVLRKIAFRFKPVSNEIVPSGGLFGAFSYDFIDCFEKLPLNEEEESKPVYEFYFLDNLFLIDKTREKAFIISNALVVDSKIKKLEEGCERTIESYEKALKKKMPKPKSLKKKELVVKAEEKEIFEKKVHDIKKSVLEGDIYLAYASRKIDSNFNSEPFDVYKEFIKQKPRSYMFYINTDIQLMLGSSPEVCMEIKGEKEKIVEVALIARTKPTGNGSNGDKDLDNRFEAELKTDFNEISKHIMAIDSVRSDISRISEIGTRHLDKVFVIEKYPKEQNLVSNVKGILRKDLDAFNAYYSCMNRISGCPRVEAMRVLRDVENRKLGYLLGTVCFITPDKNFKGAIMKNSMILDTKSKKAEFLVNTDIIYDSVAEEEFESTEEKIKDFIEAIKSAGGLK